jgi:hypothetical protein
MTLAGWKSSQVYARLCFCSGPENLSGMRTPTYFLIFFALLRRTPIGAFPSLVHFRPTIRPGSRLSVRIGVKGLWDTVVFSHVE